MPKNNPQEIQFIYFDIGGVFLDWYGGFARVARALMVPEQAVIDALAQFGREIDLGGLTWDELGQRLQKEHKSTHGFVSPLFKEFVAGFTTISAAHQLAKDLEGKLKLGLLSDVELELFKHTSTQGKIPSVFFETKVISSEVGFVKPQPEIYEIAENRAGVVPEKIFFIDDKPENIAGALARGWQGYVFDTNQPKKAVAEIRQLLTVPVQTLAK